MNSVVKAGLRVLLLLLLLKGLPRLSLSRGGVLLLTALQYLVLRDDRGAVLSLAVNEEVFKLLHVINLQNVGGGSTFVTLPRGEVSGG